MKCFLKKLSGAALAALLIIGNTGFFTNVLGNNLKMNVGGYTLSVRSNKIFKNREARLSEIINLINNLFKDEDNSFKCIILDCGVYGNVFHSRGYESHHLISNHFCKNHENIISTDEAPAVLIPECVHKKTGSYKQNSDSEYFKKEEKCFSDNGGDLKAVFDFGLNDLKKAIHDAGINCGDVLNDDSPIVVKLNKYVDLLVAICDNDLEKVQSIKEEIFTPFKRRTVSREKVLRQNPAAQGVYNLTPMKHQKLKSDEQEVKKNKSEDFSTNNKTNDLPEFLRREGFCKEIIEDWKKSQQSKQDTPKRLTNFHLNFSNGKRINKNLKSAPMPVLTSYSKKILKNNDLNKNKAHDMFKTLVKGFRSKARKTTIKLNG